MVITILLESTENFELEDAWKGFTLPELLFFLARSHVDRRGTTHGCKALIECHDVTLSRHVVM